MEKIGRYLGQDVYEYRSMEDYIADLDDKRSEVSRRLAYGLVDNIKLCYGNFIVGNVNWSHGDNDVTKLKYPLEIPRPQKEVPFVKEEEEFLKQERVDIKLPSIEDIIKEIRGLEMIVIEE